MIFIILQFFHFFEIQNEFIKNLQYTEDGMDTFNPLIFFSNYYIINYKIYHL